MKYYRDNTEITKEKAYNYIKDFSRRVFNQDFQDFYLDGLFSTTTWKGFQIRDPDGEAHVISSKVESYFFDCPSNSKQLSLF